jgi:hypothetical protein
MTTLKKNALLAVATVGILVGMTSSAKAQTYTWDMTNPTPSSGSITNVTAGAISRANNNGTTNTLFNNSSGSNNSGASAGNNAGLAVFSGAFNSATSSYFEFTLTPSTGLAVQFTGITFGTRSTGTGPQTLSIRTSVDSFATNAGSVTVSNNSIWVPVTPTIATPVTSAVSTALTVRIYGSGVVGTPTANTTTWRVDDLTVTASAIPEPTTLALLALGGAGMMVRLRRKK